MSTAGGQSAVLLSSLGRPRRPIPAATDPPATFVSAQRDGRSVTPAVMSSSSYKIPGSALARSAAVRQSRALLNTTGVSAVSLTNSVPPRR